MVVAQRVTLSRSCSACAKTKRKCDLALPRCSRCTKKGAQCVYLNEPLSSHKVVKRRDVHGQTDILTPTSQGSEESYGNAQSYEELGSWNMPAYSPGDSMDSNSDALRLVPVVPSPLMRPKDVDGFLTMDPLTLVYIVSQLQALPTTLVRSGGTTFIHHQLYQVGLPAAMRNAYAACTTAQAQSDFNRSLTSQTLDSIIVDLLSLTSSIVTFADMLAFVQALVLVQILTLFSTATSVKQRLQAERRQVLLSQWSRKLWMQAPGLLPESFTPFEAYVFAESVRRTVIVSQKVRLTYEILKMGGFVYTMFCEALPFDRRTSLWDVNTEAMWNQYAEGTTPDIVSFREFTDLWDAREVTKGGLFETMLLVACRGKVMVEGRIKENQFIQV